MNIAFAGFRHPHIFVLYNEAITHKNATVTGAFEENAHEREKVAAERGVSFSYSSYEELLNDPKVDTVGIGDYYGKRGSMIIEALRHGKHVICDKPICTSLSELEEIKRLASEKKLAVHCMLELRFLAQAEQVRQLIAAGEIGDIKNASFTGQHHLNYGVRPDWYYKEGHHGGTINDIAIHGVDILRYLTGKNLTKVNFARTWNAFADKEPQFRDCGQFMADMDGMAVMADVSYAAPKCPDLPTYWDFYLWGSLGMINFRCADNNISIYKDTKEVITCEKKPFSFIDCLSDELCGRSSVISTAEVLESARQTLTVQAFADSIAE